MKVQLLRSLQSLSKNNNYDGLSPLQNNFFNLTINYKFITKHMPLGFWGFGVLGSNGKKV